MNTNTVHTTGIASHPGIVGDAYVASLRVTMKGDVLSDSLTLDGPLFEHLLGLLQMRHIAFEPQTRILRAHSSRAAMIVQRLDRLRDVIEAGEDDHPGICDAAQRLREIAEMADTVSWSVA